jgi:glycosyltransferase involved in cell wall biosynthesis
MRATARPRKEPVSVRLALLAHQAALHDGQGRVNYELARAALDRGDHVTLFAENCAPELAAHPNARYVRARMDGRRLPTQLWRNVDFARRSSRWLRAHRDEFDLVQANGFTTYAPADIVAVHWVNAAWLRNVHYPFHWRSFSPYAWYQRALCILSARQELQVFRAARRIIAVSRATANEVIALGIPAEKLRVVYNGVDTVAFTPGQPQRAHFGLPPDAPLALFVGDIKTSRKNLEAVLHAMQPLPALHLAVAGALEGSPYPALAQRLGLADRVHFLGKTQDVPALMRSCDMFVFPSRYEAHPLVLMEAMASGLPVVVSNNFGAADYVGAGGLVFGGPEDVPALTAAMRILMEQPARRSEMAAAAREVALTMQWSACTAGYLRLYDEMLAELAPDRQGSSVRA